ncbi:FtsQ-type POTRA domain-containing protein [Herbivorax sp. ANBcel31]|uniref:cell division protein FtsQ/DivIB n=1 Tax=Herbivorax sp. ANBcel31 TaxID=3069754 RepID=UPI0027B522C6|nr:FtsQ-type POTRA domain-containing protein [Herbivorax sp. ANBcel31]MDQ2085914.1 FtsQ-type POTRA domain-containing protein [Herbivorax sp. ANBcel31]
MKKSGTLNKKEKKKQKNKKIIKNFFCIIFIAVLIVGLALSPLFYINSIEVYGNKHYNNSEVVEASRMPYGVNWFKEIGADIKGILTFRSTQSENNILSRCSYVKDVVVRMAYPGVVKITITEREPVAVVPYISTSLIIDSEGYVVDAENEKYKEVLPVIEGLDVNGYRLGQMLRSNNIKGIDAFNRVFDTIDFVKKTNEDKDYVKGLDEYISNVDVEDLDNILIFLDSRITVNLGAYSQIDEYTIVLLEEIFFNNIDKDKKGYLDLTTGDSPTFIPE